MELPFYFRLAVSILVGVIAALSVYWATGASTREALADLRSIFGRAPD